VLLRPLWQDEQLAPLAAVLGPGEIAYHAQLTPLYEELGVEAARPVSRPHVFLLPRELPWPESIDAQRRLIAGGVEASRWLAEQALDPPDAERLEDARRAAREVWTRLREQLDEFLHVEVDRAQERIEQEFARVRTEAAKAARAKRGGAWSWGPDFLSVRGVPQERALCVATLPVWWGDATGATLDALAQIYVEAVDAGSVPAWVVRGGPA
jgi:uncharacterized protein YllA (UPF0747 family)